MNRCPNCCKNHPPSAQQATNFVYVGGVPDMIFAGSRYTTASLKRMKMKQLSVKIPIYDLLFFCKDYSRFKKINKYPRTFSKTIPHLTITK